MGFLDRVGGFAEKAGEKMSKAASGAADKAKLIAEKTKLNSQINNEKSNIEKVYKELGKKYFEVSGNNPGEEFAEMVARINESMNRISDIQQQLASLEVENTCPKCGAAMKKDQQFCQACGSKQENFVDVSPSDVEVVTEVEKAVDGQN